MRKLFYLCRWSAARLQNNLNDEPWTSQIFCSIIILCLLFHISEYSYIMRTLAIFCFFLYFSSFCYASLTIIRAAHPSSPLPPRVLLLQIKKHNHIKIFIISSHFTPIRNVFFYSPFTMMPIWKSRCFIITLQQRSPYNIPAHNCNQRETFAYFTGRGGLYFGTKKKTTIMTTSR